MWTTAFLNSLIEPGPICRILAQNLFGCDQFQKLMLRYADMRDNFNNVTYDDAGACQSNIWKFSSGITPFNDFDDTTSVPIPITHPYWREITKGSIVSCDLPLWFVTDASKPTVMLVSQDPMPRAKCYEGCHDAVCSSTFGLHYKVWRENGKGGRRMWLLSQLLLEAGLNIYLTDAVKLNLSHPATGMQFESLTHFNDMLSNEIGHIKPILIVTLGNKAAESVKMLNPCIPYISMPHFCGMNQKSITDYFAGNDISTIDKQAALYSNHILKHIHF